MTRRRRTWWLVGFLLVSLFVAILLTVKQQETLFTGLEYAAFREACARAPASEIPFWTEAGINCRITTSNIWLLLFNWSAVLAFLAGVAVLAMGRGLKPAGCLRRCDRSPGGRPGGQPAGAVPAETAERERA